MADHDPNIFYSGKHDKNTISAEDFTCHVTLKMQSMALTTNTNKLEAFGDFLMAGEPADKWWKARKVTTTLITQWADVQTAFVAKFDVLQAAEKTKQEWEQELSKL
ncbi:unnamed protein product [Mycena citricolor]|uniref:Uncharacterized protein n=1 Tax=Mycena citricolor TaxID=2018698 RepID=A0AAD2H086_9AGAR|nr:unnamed protein product [Mycena citricolor]